MVELSSERIEKILHEETKSLIKYYYMDNPQDICSGIKEFENEYNAKLLGPKWHEYFFDAYDDFRIKNEDEYNSEGYYKLEFSKQALETFYEAMDYVFREGFGTNSKVIADTVSGLVGMFLGKD